MIKSVIRTALVATLAVGVMSFTQTVRAEDKAPAAPAAPAKAEAHQAQGVVESVDAAAKTVTIKHKKEMLTFSLAADAKLTGEGKKDITIADLKKGDHVMIHYTEVGGKNIASHIGHVNPPEKK